MLGCETVLINGIYQSVCPQVLFGSGGVIGLIVGGAIGYLLGRHKKQPNRVVSTANISGA